MLKDLEKKMVDIAENYADLIKKMMEQSSESRYVDLSDIDCINKGIEALNIVVSAISKIEERPLPMKDLSIKE